MPRVQTLSDDEYKILQLIRESQQRPIRTATIDIRREIDTAVYELESVEGYGNGYNQSESVIESVLRRLRGIQY